MTKLKVSVHNFTQVSKKNVYKDDTKVKLNIKHSVKV